VDLISIVRIIAALMVLLTEIIAGWQGNGP
jgi:hypothetical protein